MAGARLILLLELAGGPGCQQLARRQVTAAKRAEHWFAGRRQVVAADTGWRASLPRFPGRWLLPALTVIAVTTVAGVLRYPDLPARLSVYRRAAGTQIPGSAFAPVIGQGYVTALWTPPRAHAASRRSRRAADLLRVTVSSVRYRCLHRPSPGGLMPYIVDFENVSTVGLEPSPVAQALAGLRANEARYFKNKYGHVFTVIPASEAPQTLDWVNRILADERDLAICARPLEVTSFEVDGIRMAYVFYESGLSINVMYTILDQGKRAVGFKLSEGMEVPEELAAAGFKFARQKSKLAGVIRGSFFVIKGEY